MARVSKLDLGVGTHNADLLVTLSWPIEDGDYTGKVIFANGRDLKVEEVANEPGLRMLNVSGEFLDMIDLSAFPFDAHRLDVIVQDEQATVDEVVFEVDAASTAVDNPTNTLAGWLVEGVEPVLEVVDQREGVAGTSSAVFSLNISRITLASVMKYQLPVYFMIFVSSLALLLRPASVVTRISMGTATLLAAVMFHLSSTSSLPPTGYLTLQDKFMVGTYLIIVANILFSVLILKANDREDVATADRLDGLAVKVVPALILVVYYLVLGDVI